MAFTTVIYRHVNYSKRAKFAKTLAHSLRVKTSEFKSNEWVEQLQDFNFIFDDKHPDGLRLNSISLAKRQAYIDRVLSSEFDSTNATKEDKANFKRYEYKLKQKIAKSTSDGDLYVAKALRHIASKKPKNYREIIESIEGVKRKNQLLGMLDKYMDFASKVKGTTDQRQARVHEAFFKFPHKHGVKADAKQMADCIRSFYAEIAPNHKPKLVVVHDDERTKNSSTGIHPHIFLSTKDSVTGERNLNVTLRNAANDYLAATPTNVQLWNAEEQIHETHRVTNIDIAVSGYAASKLQGIVIQDMFMSHVRKQFPNLSIDFSESRSRKIKAFHEQYEDAKQPKANREYNLNALLRNANNDLRIKMKKEVAQHRAKLDEELRFHQASIAQKADELADLDKRLDRYKSMINRTDATLKEISKKASEIDDQIKQGEARVADLKAQEETLLDSIKQKLAEHVERFMAAYSAMFENILNNRSAFTNGNQVLTIFRSTNEDARYAMFDQVDSNQTQLESLPNIKPEGKAIHTDIHNKFKEMVCPNPAKVRSPSPPRL
ncbi:hypothetical protein P3383_05880 [Vibrio parahaemolyticus]|nr:hypothetical protein [Vibrio parahaemolyticus]EHK5156913.1 hypothetical protein [Vibrio parahaemolyticus]EHZ7318753.1 hypothetical protein [Vibrio parahaemolyticus]EIA4664276.1 hypothetical protein [Vibrio parahaemolyticus]EIC2729519.1 hypothetical protein [Vibrio parahaemolyticus]